MPTGLVIGIYTIGGEHMMNFVGQTLGQYRIEALLGTGVIGQVFRGMQVQLNRPASIKVMPTTLKELQPN